MVYKMTFLLQLIENIWEENESSLEERYVERPLTYEKVSVHNSAELGLSTSRRKFRRTFRMDESQLNALVNAIKDDEQFQSNGKRQQLPVDKQIGIFLSRMGSKGTYVDAAIKFQVSEGMIGKVMHRVSSAIISKLKSLVTGWPNEECRRLIRR